MRFIRNLAFFDEKTYDLLWHLAESAQLSEWYIDIIPCWDGLPLLMIRKKVKI